MLLFTIEDSWYYYYYYYPSCYYSASTIRTVNDIEKIRKLRDNASAAAQIKIPSYIVQTFNPLLVFIISTYPSRKICHYYDLIKVNNFLLMLSAFLSIINPNRTKPLGHPFVSHTIIGSEDWTHEKVPVLTSITSTTTPALLLSPH